MINFLHTLWKFSRPHTIIGSVISIITLWLLALKNDTYSEHVYTLLLTLLAGITCNIFIVGLNQIIDVELDKINKPKLPLADGSMTLSQAYFTIRTSLVISLISAFLAGPVLGILIIVICLIGIAYSVPPVQLKKHHLPAALSITVVRGLLVNIGMFLHFTFSASKISWQEITESPLSVFTSELWVLTGFVVAFSIAIAWFKDLPDTLGDSHYHFKTLALAYSPKFALFGGIFIVFSAYIFAVYSFFASDNDFLFFCHLTAAILFMVNVGFVKLDKPASVTRFYMIFWVFFFAEYLFFAAWSLLD
jgi:homogentisate phytyltransferase / homogentisate geranylgeranyltransferase